MMAKVIDAEGAVMGRLASMIAKELLLGEQITVVNADKAVISGRPTMVKERYLAKIQRGTPTKGPFHPKCSDGIFRRAVRGMLPKNKKGREAFARLRVHVGCPEELKEVQKMGKSAEDLRCRFIVVKDLAKQFGGRA
ncbi:MAG: 50S ribosomal protein L13 [Candidatus Aenigmatarchaeota archaeon]